MMSNHTIRRPSRPNFFILLVAFLLLIQLQADAVAVAAIPPAAAPTTTAPRNHLKSSRLRRKRVDARDQNETHDQKNESQMLQDEEGMRMMRRLQLSEQRQQEAEWQRVLKHKQKMSKKNQQEDIILGR